MGTLDDLLPIRRLLDAAGNVLTFARDLAIDSSLAWSNNATTRVATLSLSGKSTQRVVSGTAYVCDSVSTDFLLDVDTSVSSAAKLPAPSVGRVIWFVDKTGTASTNSFTIKRFGAETINGSAADLVVNANRAMVRLESDGTNWFAALFTPTVGGGSVPTGTGWTHVTGGAQDAAANHGSVAGQIPVVNAGVTDAPFV